MKNRFTILISVLLALNMIATCFLLVKALKPVDQPQNESIHYTLYIGTNDKDTYTQIMPTDEAKQLVGTICSKHVDSFTFQDAIGAWNDEKGVVTHEYTIICQFDEINEETLFRICDDLRSALNQDTILIQKECVQLDFYNGKDGE